MTVSTEITTHSYFPGSAMQPEAIPFQFLDAQHLSVSIEGGAVLVLGSDYSITGEGRTAMGVITALREFDGGDKVVLARFTPRVQEAQTEPFKPLPAEHVGRELDRRAFVEQELDEVLTRAPQLPRAGGVEGKFPVAVPGGWGWASGTGADGALREDLAGEPGGGLVDYRDDGAYADASIAGAVRSRGRSVTDAPYLAARGGLVDAADAFRDAGDGAIVPAGAFYIGSPVNAEFDLHPDAILTGPYADTVWPKGLRSENGNYYIATWSSSTTLGNRPLTIHASVEGRNWKHIATITHDADGVLWDFGDPSVFFHDGLYYVTFTNYQTDQYDFCVGVSRNLTDWKVHKCKLGTGVYKTNGTAPGWSHVFATGPWIWAPKLIKAANGTIYLTCSIRTQADQATLEGTQPFFRQYIATCTDIDALTFTAPTEVRIDGKVGPASAAAASQNRLDGSILQLQDGSWAMAIKDDYNKWIDVCVCGTINGNWSTVKTDAVPLHPGGGVNYVEGPSLVSFVRDGATRYRIYADKYYGNHQFFVESDDLLTFTAPETVQVECVIRHGRVLNLGQMPRAEMSVAVDAINRAALFLAKPPRSDIKSMFNLQDVAGFPNFSNFAPMNGCLYRFAYDATNFLVTFNGFAPVGTLPEGSYFYLVIAAGNYLYNRATGEWLDQQPMRIRFPAGATNFIPSPVDFWIGHHVGTNDTLFKFVLVDGSWRIESYGAVGLLAGENCGDIRLNSVAAFPAINNGNSNFRPIAGQTYYNIDADGACVIHSLPTDYPDGTELFWSARASTTGGNITHKAGAHAHWPADVVISGTSDNSVHFITRLVKGKWALVK